MLRRATSILLLLLLTVIWPALLIATVVETRVATNTFIEHELIKQQAYTLALDQVDQQLNTVKIDPQFPITHADLITVAHQVFTPTWLQTSVEGVLNEAWAWFHQPVGTTLTLPIDLRTPKAQLRTSVDALLTAKLKTLQPCPKVHGTVTKEGFCQFAGLSLSQLKTQLQHQGINPDYVATLLPDTLDLLHPDLSKITGPKTSPSTDQHTKSILDSLTKAKTKFHDAQSYLLASWGAFGLILLFYIALNATHGLKRLTRWLGIFGITVSILPLAISLASWPVVQQALLPHISFPSNIPTAVQQAAVSTIGDVRSALFMPILVLSLAMFVGGIVAVELSRETKRETKRK